MRLRIALCEMLLAVVASACAANVYAANTYAEERQAGLDWLKIAAFAGHQTDYSGVFVYQDDNRVEVSRIIHVAEADGEYEKLESLDGPMREIIRHHGQVWCCVNQKMEQVGDRQGRGKFSSLLPEQLSALGENYQAKEAGVERVAGYNAQVILFQPKDNLRYTHKIWVHTDSGLLLKAAVLGGKNKMVEQYAFTQLQIGGKIDRSWIKRSASTGYHGSDFLKQHEAANMGVPVNSGWEADALPSGFKKTLEIQRPMRGKHVPVTQIVFSDGMGAISIFIEPDDGDEDDVGELSSRGAVNLYHKVVDKHLITVVGEVPPSTVMRVFDSVRYNGK